MITAVGLHVGVIDRLSLSGMAEMGESAQVVPLRHTTLVTSDFA